MHRQRTPNLFRHGPSAQFRLAIWLGLALSLMVMDAHWRTLEPVRQIISMALYPLQRLTLLPRDVAAGIHNWVNAAATIRQEQEALQSQRIALALLATQSAQLAAENQQLRRLLNITEQVPQTPVAVQVLREPASTFGTTLVFNKGNSSGIARGMPVIDEAGVVGQIVRTTPATSEALLATDERVTIPTQVMRNGLRVIAFGSGVDNRMHVHYLGADADVQPGDVLITSGVGGFYPAGLPVAQISEVSHDASTGFAFATAQPLAHPRRYRHFLVLRTQAQEDAEQAHTASGQAPAAPAAVPATETAATPPAPPAASARTTRQQAQP